MLAMTCKYMNANIKPRKYLDITRIYEKEEHLSLLQWCFENEWKIFYHNTLDFVPILPILKWKFSKGLQDSFRIFDIACTLQRFDVIEYCIENYIQTEDWYMESTYSLDVIKFLFHNKKIKLRNHSIWVNYAYTEDVYEWALQYIQTDERFHLSDIFTRNIIPILEWWIESKFKNINMMFNYMDDFTTMMFGSDEHFKVPIRICQNSTYEVARAFESYDCECNDPFNHEHRKRIKIVSL